MSLDQTQPSSLDIEPLAVQPPPDSESAGGRAACHAVEVAGHELTIFEETTPLINRMVADIRAAKSRVWMESYIFAGDAAGRAIADALIDRARAGLDVRLMYDAVGSYSTPAALFAEMQSAGVQVHAYRGFWQSLFRWKFLRIFNRRNHRKLLVIDELVSYFGGMNIVDQSRIHSVADVKAQHLPASSGWRDVHVRMVGPRQADLADAMQRLWLKVHRQKGPRWPKWPLAAMLRSIGDSLWFFDSRPTRRYRRPHLVFVSLIREAERDLTLSMAYFVPVGKVRRELVRARKRGVRVRVIIPAESDVKSAQAATRHFYTYLLKRGIRIYERQDQMLHSKVMVVDNRWSIVGSCNLDPRSLRLNLEFLGVIRSAEFAHAIKATCAHEMRNSRRITMDDCYRRHWWQRLVDALAWELRWWL